MYAAELGIRTRVNGRKCELIRSLRRTLPLNPMDAGRREESGERERENRPFAVAHHLGSMPLEHAAIPSRFISRAKCLSQVRRTRVCYRVSLQLAELYLTTFCSTHFLTRKTVNSNILTVAYLILHEIKRIDSFLSRILSIRLHLFLLKC